MVSTKQISCRCIYLANIRRINTKIIVTLPQIEYVSKICKPYLDDTELSMYK